MFFSGLYIYISVLLRLKWKYSSKIILEELIIVNHTDFPSTI